MAVSIQAIQDMVDIGRCPHTEKLPVYEIMSLTGVGEYIVHIADEPVLCGKPAFWGPTRGMNTEYCREHHKAR